METSCWAPPPESLPLFVQVLTITFRHQCRPVDFQMYISVIKAGIQILFLSGDECLDKITSVPHYWNRLMDNRMQGGSQSVPAKRPRWFKAAFTRQSRLLSKKINQNCQSMHNEQQKILGITSWVSKIYKSRPGGHKAVAIHQKSYTLAYCQLVNVEYVLLLVDINNWVGSRPVPVPLLTQVSASSYTSNVEGDAASPLKLKMIETSDIVIMFEHSNSAPLFPINKKYIFAPLVASHYSTSDIGICTAKVVIPSNGFLNNFGSHSLESSTGSLTQTAR
ncbi:hypothetical protein NQ317_016455 [Molorchus minor]|uniref:Uncharacterized protein n=1 Tax=Molorchus minor TaxID=1323400 RepID=A0ABQ9K0P8_9CUCU|nr:hypothetical protein NQ317_016455 [Molorchus minor]